ncbi:MAG: PDZ domain-containing protein, partial [Verrucomicrobiota bacterium]
MKLQLTAALLIGALSTVVSAQEEEKKDTPPPAAKKEAPQKRQPAPAAKQPQRPKQTFLGVGTAPIDPSLRDHLELDPGFGVVVRMVAPDSPAADAELKKGDVLTQIDDQKLTSHEHLSILVKSKSKGDIVDISLIRKGQKKTVTAELGEVTAPQHPHVLRRELTPQQLQPYRSMPSNQRGAWEAQRRGHSPVPFPKFENQSPEEWREAIKKYQDNLRGWMKENHAQRNSSTPEQGRRGGDKPPALSVRPGFPVRVMTDNSTIMISNEKGE